MTSFTHYVRVNVSLPGMITESTQSTTSTSSTTKRSVPCNIIDQLAGQSDLLKQIFTFDPETFFITFPTMCRSWFSYAFKIFKEMPNTKDFYWLEQKTTQTLQENKQAHTLDNIKHAIFRSTKAYPTRNLAHVTTGLFKAYEELYAFRNRFIQSLISKEFEQLKASFTIPEQIENHRPPKPSLFARLFACGSQNTESPVQMIYLQKKRRLICECRDMASRSYKINYIALYHDLMSSPISVSNLLERVNKSLLNIDESYETLRKSQNSSNPLKAMPDIFKITPQLPLTQFPQEFCLSSILSLDFSNCRLGFLPPKILHLVKLTTLILQNNELQYLDPQLIGLMLYVTFLDLTRNPMTSSSEKIEEIKNILQSAGVSNKILI